MHTWPETARLCPIKGLYPDKYVLFGQKMAVCLGRLYERTHRAPVVRDNNILLQVVAALRRPLELKYRCIRQSSWRIAIEVRRRPVLNYGVMMGQSLLINSKIRS